MKSKARVVRVAMVSCAAAVIACTGCSRKEESASRSGSGTTVEAKAPSIDFNGSLVSMLPSETVAFFLWEGKHPAYQKYQASPWGQGRSDWATVLESAEGQAKQVLDVLVKANLDPKDPKTWQSLFAEASIFAAAGTGQDQPAVGAVFRAGPTVKLGDILSQLRKTVPAEEADIVDLKLAKGTGVKITPKTEANKPVFVGWNENLGVIGSAEWVLNSVIGSKGTTLPALVSSPTFTRSMVGMPENSARFGIGYADVSRFLEAAQKMDPSSTDKMPAAKDFPVQAVSVAIGMDDSPRTHARLVYDEGKAGQNEWLKSINSSASTSVAAVVPGKPLLFLSIDGQTAKRLRDASLSQQAGNPAAKAVGQQLAFLDNVKRIGLAVRTAPMGQALLPIPDILLVMESSQPQQTVQQMQALVTQIAGASGAPPMPWTESKLNDVPVKSMVSPFGVGLYLGATKDLVLAGSTEAQLKAALGASGTGFTKGLAPRAEAVFATDTSIGNLYLNFEEVAAMLESMGGLMGMYAPQNQDAAKFMQPENIDAIRKMGTVIGTVKHENGLIGIDSFYQTARAAG